MPAGLEVYPNGGSILQITGAYQNLEMSAKGSATAALWNSSFSPNRGIISITIAGTAPVIAVESSDKIALLRRVQSGSNFTFTLITENPSTTFNYLIFDRPTGSSSTDGLQVFIDTGTATTGPLAFDARKRYMRVIAVITGTATASGPVTQAASAGRVAVLLAYAGTELVSAGGIIVGGNTWMVSTTLFMAAVSYSGGQVSAARMAMNATSVSGTGSSGIPATGNWGTTAVRHLILDVSNF